MTQKDFNELRGSLQRSLQPGGFRNPITRDFSPEGAALRSAFARNARPANPSTRSTPTTTTYGKKAATTFWARVEALNSLVYSCGGPHCDRPHPVGCVNGLLSSSDRTDQRVCRKRRCPCCSKPFTRRGRQGR